MRTLLAIVIFAGGILSLNSTAEAGRNYRRSAKLTCYAVQPGHFRTCARGAWGYSPYDPTGEFKGFPGWARKGFNNLRN